MPDKEFNELEKSEDFQKLLKEFEMSVKQNTKNLTALGLSRETIETLMKTELERIFAKAKNQSNTN